MLLKNLIKNLKPKEARVKIRGISFDSRNTKKGDLFISIKGNQDDGNKYIDEAINNGAKVIIHSRTVKPKSNVIFIRYKDTRNILAKLSSRYFKKKPNNIIAVTGTNGKTSVSDFFYQIFLLQNKKSGFIGTLGTRKNKSLKKRGLTTLDPFTLNKDLDIMKRNGIDNVIIEASSHGLKQKRLNFLKIKTGIFTNLSHDHLDYHKNMNDYLNSKLILFRKLIKKKGTIITDTDINQFETIKKIQKKRKLNILTIGSDGNKFKIIDHKIFENFQVLKIIFNKKIYKLKVNLYGSIQIKNLLMSILASNTCGLKIPEIFKNIEKIKSVEGRLELVRNLPNKTKIFLDFAHTPDALKHSILSLREHFQKKITIIFGCGGERDKNKRVLMGKVARKYCDKIYVTDDNPRGENAKKIRKEIMKGLKNSSVIEIGNRKKAINIALNNSNPGEIILVAGKGHETYQDFGKRKIFFSDKRIINNFKSKKILSEKKINNLKYNASILKKFIYTKKNYLFDGVSINSKTTKKNDLFIAIKGKKKDGHKFVNEAIKNGANYCVVSKNYRKHKKFISVKNTMKFLNQLAQNKRDLSSARYIAITGSSGKTTVKTMLGNLLNTYSKTYFSPKSYNNHYGVPLSMSNTSLMDSFAVFEIGMNKFNEINKLSKLVKPHVGLITNISEAHLENFRSINDIAKAKSEIMYNISKGGTIILNHDDKFFNYFKSIAQKNSINFKSFGFSKNSNIRFKNIKKKGKIFFISIQVDRKKIVLKSNNNSKSHIMNILSCIAVANELNLDLDKVKNFFKKQDFLRGRGKINKISKYSKKFSLIDESYNANPLSVKHAINNFSNIPKKGKKKYFLFGDMLELGKNSHIYHKKISKLINKSDIDKTFVYGNKAFETFKLLKKQKRGNVIKDLNNFKNKFLEIINNGDFLMIKGSNATKLHEVSKTFLGEIK